VLPEAWREPILEDLEELRGHRARRDGERAAKRWHRRQLLLLLFRFPVEGMRRWVRREPLARPRRSPEPLRELRLALRGLARHPSFTLPAVGILGLSLGAAATLYTVVDGVLREPLPLPESERLALLCEEHATLDGLCIGSVGTTRELVDASPVLVAGGVARSWGASLEDWVGRTGLASGIADPGFFEALGLPPLHGRLFLADEMGPDRDDVLLLTHPLWMRRYGGDPSVVGRSVQLDGEPVTIVGVLHPDFVVPTQPGIEAWRPVHVDLADPQAHSWRGFQAVVRLAPGVSPEAARVRLAEGYARLAETTDAIDAEWRLGLHGWLDEMVASARPTLHALFGGVLLLLLIGCVNVANLVFARTAMRARELDVRAALGAGRGGLIRLVSMEGALVGLGAALLALGTAALGVDVLLRLAPPGLPRVDNVSLDASTVLFVGGTAVATVFLFGAVPALMATRRTGPATGRAFTDGRRAARARRGLVVAELALSTALLFGGIVLARTLSAWSRWDPGFDREGLVVTSLLASTGAQPTRADVAALWERVEATLEEIPGVEAVATASAVPLRGGRETTEWVAERVSESSGPARVARWYDVGPGYFRLLGLTVEEGREFSEQDVEGAEPVAVVNRALAGSAWPGGGALGRWVEVKEGPRGERTRLRIVGVVADVPPVTPGVPPEPEIWWPNRQAPRWGTLVVLRTRPGTTGIQSEIDTRLAALEPTLSVGSTSTVEDLFRRPLARPRFHSILAAALAAMAVLLSGMGVYGALAWDVARARRAIGLRLALGATSTGEARRLVSSALGTAVLGMSTGFVLALVGARFIEALVQGVSATDPLSLGLAGLLVLGLTPVAAWVPARRAARVDPTSLMREE
jgi:predicted permease